MSNSSERLTQRMDAKNERVRRILQMQQEQERFNRVRESVAIVNRQRLARENRPPTK